MLLALYQQHLDPLAGKVPGSAVWSTLLAGLPVAVLFWLLVLRRWPAPRAGGAAALAALLVAVTVFGMDPGMACMAFAHGAAFALLPVGWTIFNAMLLYNVTVQTGQFDVIRRSVAGLSGDARIQAILIAFAFGAFLEGAAGGGTPVAICGAMMVGLGFSPFQAAVLCLIANTSPVAFGGLGTPLIVLGDVTRLDAETLSVMAGHQLPVLSLLVPLYMVRCMCTWRQTLEVWPALLVAGGTFSGFQFFFATAHHHFHGPVLFPMTDIGGGLFSLVVTAIFLRFWKPKQALRPDKAAGGPPPTSDAARKETDSPAAPEKPLTLASVTLAWTPFALMSVLLLLTGVVRQREGLNAKLGPVMVGPLRTNYMIPVPTLHQHVQRDPRLHDPELPEPPPESAEFNFCWLTAPGTAVFVAAILSMAILGMGRRQVAWTVRRTAFQMKVPIPTIAFMLGLSYVTRYSGMDATLGYAFAKTGFLYPFFAALLGWLGVFLTGTDAGSNALFGSLQKITATEVAKTGAFAHLSTGQAQVLICTANSTGGVMGKMIDAQSIVVATAATNQLGREADIFKAVVWHSIFLAVVVGLMTLLQAYVYPFTRLVPTPAGP
jgi:lactate permease